MERKLYKCKQCGRLVPIRSKGLCPACRSKQLADKTKPEIKHRIKPIIKSRKTTDCLHFYFDYHINKLSQYPYSMESGIKISNPNKSNICHILPKRKVGGFYSQRCNIDNTIYLTIQEHNRFDQLLDNRDWEKLEMEFPNVMKKLKVIVPKLLELATERNKAYFSFKEYFDYDKDIH